jgi:8-oxo-dGTP pyrophosphatase MutT (NUDIX family)
LRLLKEIYRKNNINLLGKMIFREAVRGIIKHENKLLMVYSSKDGDYKFPGGGVDVGETHEEALVREIREECGAKVINIYSGFGKTIEYDIPIEIEYDVFKMISYYYVCNVDPILGEKSLDEYEEKLGFEPVWIDIDSAIEANKTIINTKTYDAPRWTQRELFVLELLKKEFI